MDPAFSPLDLKHLSDSRVAILGLGLMGGSLALGLRGRCAGLLGIDPDPDVRRLASSLSLFEVVSGQAQDLLPEANLIILAAPVCAILDLLDELPNLHKGRAAVIDLGSTKSVIVKKMAALPDRFDPLGGHPMCGKERGGLANADPDIYREAVFAFTPLERTREWARMLARELADAVRARLLWLDPTTHDRWVASTSHLPYLAAGSLASVIPPEAFAMAGPGLRGTARLAATPWSMIRDVLATNRPNLLASLKSYRERIEELERMLENEDFEGLEERLAQGAANYQVLMNLGQDSL